MRVTDFPHVRQAFTDAYARLVAMKLFANRAIDYMRTASPEDRRYLLFNPLTKMKVTTEGERVIDVLWDVMAAKGFERDMFFEMAAKDIRGLPKLEGTVHVNMALVLKFMGAYLFNADPDLAPPGAHARRRRRRVPVPAGPGPRPRARSASATGAPRSSRSPTCPNVARFVELAESFKQLLVDAAPDADQQKDLDYLLTLGELFTLIPYGQLICEQAEFVELPARHARPDLRRPDPRLLGLRGRAARQDLGDRRPGRLGPRGDHPPGRRRRALRLGLRHGPRPGGHLRDAQYDDSPAVPSRRPLRPCPRPARTIRSSSGTFGISLVIRCIVPRKRWSSG